MDPFTALSFASNIVSFVDFASKLIMETNEIVQSADGMNDKTRSLSTIVRELEISNAAIGSISDTTNNPELRRVIEQCKHVSKQLTEVLNDLRVQPGQPKWKSFIVAIKGVLKKNEVEALFISLSNLRQIALGHLNAIVAENSSNLLNKMDNLGQMVAMLKMENREREESQSDLIESQDKLLRLCKGIAEDVKRMKNIQATLDKAITEERNARQKREVARKKELENLEKRIKKLDKQKLDEASGDQETQELRKRELEMLKKDLEKQTEVEEQDPTMIFETTRVQEVISGIPTSFLPSKTVYRMDKVAAQGSIYEQDVMFLKRLYFEGIMIRHNNIKQAHPETCAWILQDEKKKKKKKKKEKSSVPAVGFRSWLESGTGLFWIHGKPGCGKSTLMKYVCSEPLTQELLNTWAGAKKLSIARFFFWRAGASLGRTQVGLLRSLIFEMLRGCHELIPIARDAATAGSSESSDAVNNEPSWTKDQLLQIYKAVVGQTLTTRFCIFIDGLDEYDDKEERPQDLVKTIRELNLSDDVKLCISSRPYPIFVEEFGHKLAPNVVLKVEDHTKDDIEHYIRKKFDATGNFAQLESIQSEYSDFIGEVASKAEGVFLWVYLVVANLERGIYNGDSLVRLRQRLDSYPSDLDEFFLQMLRDIEKPYRKQAMRTFDTVTSALHPLPTMLFWFLFEIDEDPSLTEQWKNKSPSSTMMTGANVNNYLIQLRRKLQAQSQGLLEIVSFQVDFIHRTVRDFLSTSQAVQEQFRAELHQDPRSTSLLLCHSILNLFQTTSSPQSDFSIEGFRQALVRDLYFYVSKARYSDPPLPEKETSSLLNNIEMLYNRKVLADNRKRASDKLEVPQDLFLSLDAQYGFLYHFQARLNKHGKTILKGTGRPILDCALVEIPGGGPVVYSPKIIKLLIENDCWVTKEYQSATILQRFIVHLCENGKGRGLEIIDDKPRQVLIDILNYMLNNVNNRSLLQLEIETGQGSRKIEDVLKDILTDEEQKRVLGRSAGRVARLIARVTGSSS